MTKIRLSKCSLGNEEIAAVEKVLASEYLGMGREVGEFEKELSEYFGHKKEVVCVNTGTAALHLAIECSDIGPGDEVLVPSITYVACFQAVIATGAKAIPVDVSGEDCFVDLNDAQNYLSEKTKAIMPVHYASANPRINEVYEFSERNSILTIEDASHCFGVNLNDCPVGTNGAITCFSFDGIKNITSGEGGVLVTSNAKLAGRARDARLLGVQRDSSNRIAGKRSWEFDVAQRGWRYHMSDIMAAIGREQLKKLQLFLTKRVSIAKYYCEELSGLSTIKLFQFSYKDSAMHIFPIRVLNGEREGLAKFLADRGIETGVHYKPSHLLSLFSSRNDLSMSEVLGKELLSLPIHADLTHEEQEIVTSSIREYFD